ncbi:MAG: MAPEG family protein [Henriciella sp.]|jgi:uncharacterized membrane protein YecN with MAPEG domain
MTALQVAAVYIAANILIMVYLAFRVVARRFKGNVSMGDGGSKSLAKAIRVHGNASEYIPGTMVGLLALAFLSAPLWAIHAIGIMFTLGRLLHAVGMSRGPIQFRQLGIMLTWAAMVILSLALLYHAFT